MKKIIVTSAWGAGYLEGGGMQWLNLHYVAGLRALGFEVIRTGNHIALARTESDGAITPMTLPGHRLIKGSTLRTALTQSGIARDDFVRAYEQA